MRALLEILEDEQRLVYQIRGLVKAADFMSDQVVVNKLHGEKIDLEVKLEEVQDEIREYFEVLNK